MNMKGKSPRKPTTTERIAERDAEIARLTTERDTLRAEVAALRELLRRARATMVEIPSPPYPWDEINVALTEF